MAGQKISLHDQNKIEEFWAIYRSSEFAYAHANFSFIAVPSEHGLQLVQGHIILPIGDFVPPRIEVRTASICGCSVRLSELGVDSPGLVNMLLNDGLETPIGKVFFAHQEEGKNEVSAYLETLPSNFYSSEIHPARLTLSTGSHPFVNRQAEFQSDLRASTIPYDSVVELSNELGLLPLRWDTCALAVTAHGVMAVDLNRHIKNGVAPLAIWAVNNINVAHVRLGYRIQDKNGKTLDRRSVEGDQMQWSLEDKHVLIGELTVNVPEGAIVQCFASYQGRWMHQGWITDPDHTVNIRRVAHEVFDKKIEGVRRSLVDPKVYKENARNLESGTANLLFMLGFSVNPLSSPFTSEAPDLLAFTNRGNIAVVECTTGAIDNNGKLTKLLERTAALSEKLQATGSAHIKCLPVIVTPLPRHTITDLELATEKGIVVIGLDDLQRAFEETLMPKDPDQIFDKAWASVQPL